MLSICKIIVKLMYVIIYVFGLWPTNKDYYLSGVRVLIQFISCKIDIAVGDLMGVFFL